MREHHALLQVVSGPVLGQVLGRWGIVRIWRCSIRLSLRRSTTTPGVRWLHFIFHLFVRGFFSPTFMKCLVESSLSFWPRFRVCVQRSGGM